MLSLLKIILIISTIISSKQINCLSVSDILKILKSCADIGLGEDPTVNIYNLILISIFHYLEYKKKLELKKNEKEIDILDDINKMDQHGSDIEN